MNHERRYVPRTVIAAQKRVLELTAGYLRAFTDEERRMLRANGGGMMTIDELLHHIDSAIALKVTP